MIPLVLAALLAADPDVASSQALADPPAAVEWILADGPQAGAEPASAAWNGALGDALIRGLFGFYRTVLSSQDSQVCGFSPSCSRFSQLAITRLGFVRGVLITADRLLRDHPLALGHYEQDPATGLLLDDPGRYRPEVGR